jgi:exodeoxyribonuclease V gamma subunit
LSSQETVIGLHVFISNRMEILVEELAALVRTPLASPLAPEIVVVQSRGMERWVSMELARINGICANIRFPFPNAFLEMAFEAVAPSAIRPSPFDPDILTFRVMSLVRNDSRHPDFKPIVEFLEEDARGVKRFQLSRKIADLFDQYLIFRPDMIERWEQGPPAESAPQRWQALIWRELVRLTPELHRVGRRRRLSDAIRVGAADLGKLPQRVALFGVSYLPRFHMEIIAGLSHVMEVHVFSMNPCREYWADIVSEREAYQAYRRPGVDEALAANDLHLERGNRLLASLGAQGRHFLSLLADIPADQTEAFAEPDGSSLLGRLQSDILHLREPQAGLDLALDGSIQIHVCHSPMREIEVLQDQLLAMLDEDARLQPGDIVVMTPDIETHAPFISAVFGAQDRSERRIPFHIADRGPHRESSVWRSFRCLLDLRDSRFTVSEVLRLLESPGILKRFGLEDLHLPRLEQWIQAAGVCWGEDERTPRALELPDCAQNTWKAGMERLLLGYALPAEGNEVFHGLRGQNLIEGAEARVLGAFLDFLEQVFAWATRLRRSRRLSAWRDELVEMLAAFFAEDELHSSDIQQLHRLLQELSGLEASSGFAEEVALDVPAAFLTERMEAQGPGRGFMSGGVTFCSMLPMRTIPFQVICLVGMNHDAYPRENRQITFDVMAQAPRPGDRSRRNDDKYLFLEAMLAARRRLYISYVGQSIQDNSRIPPSVVVSELIDTLQSDYGLPVEDPKRPLVIRHALQPFSESYFRPGSVLFSFSTEDLQTCKAMALQPSAPLFAAEPIALTAEEALVWRSLDLDQLAAFYGHPVRFFFKKRLGVSLDLQNVAVADSEPFILKGLERFHLGARLLEQRLLDQPVREVFAALQADGRLPHGAMGEVVFQDLWDEVERFARRLEAQRTSDPAGTLDVQWEIGGFSLTARLGEVSDSGCLRYRFGKLRPKDRLDLWLRHLGLCLARPETQTCESVLVCSDCTLRLKRPADGRSILESVLDVFRQGLERPLRFFPESSLEYAKALRIKGGERQALAAARSRWEGSDFSRGEGDDPYHQRCFEGVDALDAEFKAFSRRLFDPFLECAREERVV